MQKEHANDKSEEDDDDDVMMLDKEEETTQDDLGRPSVNRLLNISNENLPEERIAMPERAKEDPIEEEDKVEEEDDVVVVKASIYNFQGKISSYEEELENNIFSFNTYDDHSKDVFIVGEDESDEETEDVAEMEEDPVETEEEMILFKCDHCEEKFLHESNLSKHVSADHPPRPTQLKQFNNGCFFIMSG